MRLEHPEALRRLASADHAVLATLDPDGAPDVVPVCFAVASGIVGVPIDRVKPKASVRLQRVRNLERDPRATLLCERWDHDDWSRLWWVRARLTATAVDDPISEALERALGVKHPQYAGVRLDALITLRIEEVTGWTAGE